MMSRPAAFNSVASAVMPIVADGFTRARRSARKAMTLIPDWNAPKPNGSPHRCEAPSVEFGRQFRGAVMREHAAYLIGDDPADRNLRREVFFGKEADFGCFEAGLRRAAEDRADEEQLVDMERTRRKMR